MLGPTPLATALRERNGHAGQGRGDVDLRLAALRESPHAFWAKLSDEQRYSREQWTSFLGAVAWFVARQDNGPAIGMAGLLQQDPGPQLISMWVAPHQRGQGIGARLTRAVVDLATGQGVPWRSVDTLPAYHDAAAGGHQLVIGVTDRGCSERSSLV